MQPTITEVVADKRVGLMRQEGNDYQIVATYWEVGSDRKGKCLFGNRLFIALSVVS
ncbi:hypothetical protein [Prevotella aurantiaca]|uniref:Uncharacterized protein n=1 Tax=Prevotella aurantiaca TaxID=596085 RepID=A0A930HKG1_9BACT|nr:hypothetical protein [Prevotella aurantiaca]MBF1383373.1 hypothetical protein [Prevotella aurantiaca]